MFICKKGLILNACTALNLIQVFVNGKGLGLVIYEYGCKKGIWYEDLVCENGMILR